MIEPSRGFRDLIFSIPYLELPDVDTRSLRDLNFIGDPAAVAPQRFLAHVDIDEA